MSDHFYLSVIGPGGCGKTTFIKALCDGVVKDPKYIPTSCLTANHFGLLTKAGDKYENITLTILDAPGQQFLEKEKGKRKVLDPIFDNQHPIIYDCHGDGKGVDGVFYMFDLTSSNTYLTVKQAGYDSMRDSLYSMNDGLKKNLGVEEDVIVPYSTSMSSVDVDNLKTQGKKVLPVFVLANKQDDTENHKLKNKNITLPGDKEWPFYRTALTPTGCKSYMGGCAIYNNGQRVKQASSPIEEISEEEGGFKAPLEHMLRLLTGSDDLEIMGVKPLSASEMENMDGERVVGEDVTE